MLGFSGLGRRSLHNERQINRWKGIVSGFKGKLVKMIKDINGRFDDYSISPKLRQKFIALEIWINWKWSDIIYFFDHMKMSYYQFNRQEILQKVKDKEKADKYYFENEEFLKENRRNKYRNLSEEEK